MRGNPYPFLIAIIIPITGERPIRAISRSPNSSNRATTRALGPSAIQAFIFQQVLALLVGLTTVTGGMAVAAHSVIGEKQARTPSRCSPRRSRPASCWRRR